MCERESWLLVDARHVLVRQQQEDSERWSTRGNKRRKRGRRVCLCVCEKALSIDDLTGGVF